MSERFNGAIYYIIENAVKIKYKQDIIVMFAFIFAAIVSNNNDIKSLLFTILAYVIFYHRELKLHIDDKAKRD